MKSTLVIYLSTKSLLSRNYCQKCVRDNSVISTVHSPHCTVNSKCFHVKFRNQNLSQGKSELISRKKAAVSHKIQDLPEGYLTQYGKMINSLTIAW